MQSRGEPTQAEFHDVITNRADRWFAACLKITRNRAMAEDVDSSNRRQRGIAATQEKPASLI